MVVEKACRNNRDSSESNFESNFGTFELLPFKASPPTVDSDGFSHFNEFLSLLMYFYAHIHPFLWLHFHLQ